MEVAESVIAENFHKERVVSASSRDQDGSVGTLLEVLGQPQSGVFHAGAQQVFGGMHCLGLFQKRRPMEFHIFPTQGFGRN